MGVLSLFKKNKRALEHKNVVVATMHNKQEAIMPIFKSKDITWIDAENLNTDRFGTFSGEIPRKRSALETVIEKAKLAVSLTNADVAIANEGSFGAHPNIPWIPSDTEIMVWYDAKNEVTIRETLVSIETNFSKKVISTKAELFEFAKKAKFPSHQLILRPKVNSIHSNSSLKLVGQTEIIFKDFSGYSDLEICFERCWDASPTGEIIIETDMRADRNPTRMKVIQQLARSLNKRIDCKCPMCDNPGFGLVHTIEGLPCSSCTIPTTLVHFEIHACNYCNYSEKKKRRDGLEYASPSECGICNP